MKKLLFLLVLSLLAQDPVLCMKRKRSEDNKKASEGEPEKKKQKKKEKQKIDPFAALTEEERQYNIDVLRNLASEITHSVPEGFILASERREVRWPKFIRILACNHKFGTTRDMELSAIEIPGEGHVFHRQFNVHVGVLPVLRGQQDDLDDLNVKRSLFNALCLLTGKNENLTNAEEFYKNSESLLPLLDSPMISVIKDLDKERERMKRAACQEVYQFYVDGETSENLGKYLEHDSDRLEEGKEPQVLKRVNTDASHLCKTEFFENVRQFRKTGKQQVILLKKEFVVIVLFRYEDGSDWMMIADPFYKSTPGDRSRLEALARKVYCTFKTDPLPEDIA